VVIFVISAVIQDNQPTDREIPLICKKEGCCRMSVEEIPSWVQPDTFLIPHGRYPLWYIPVDPSWQAQEIPYLFPVGKVNLKNIHGRFISPLS
jgi:hypothetical protein